MEPPPPMVLVMADGSSDKRVPVHSRGRRENQIVGLVKDRGMSIRGFIKLKGNTYLRLKKNWQGFADADIYQAKFDVRCVEYSHT